MSRTIAALSAALVLAASPVAAADGPRPIDLAIEKVMERGWPAVAVLVEAADGTVQTAASGLASLERGTPLTADAGFHMCSITKAFTAVAALRLVDEGRLSLDDKVTAILDQAVVKRIPYIEDITVGQLLDHSSGIYPTNNDRTYLDTLIGAGAFSGRVWTPQEMVELATRPDNKPRGKPGEGHYYSDTNYILLGMIVERVSHEPFKAYVARTILKPLGMDATYFQSDVLAGKHAASPSVANGYIKLSKELTDAITLNPRFPTARTGWLNTSIAAESIDAAGGLVTTLPDLRKFAAALFRGKLLSPTSQSFMTAVEGEMAGVEVGKQKTRAMEAVATAFGLVLFKGGDGPGGFNTLMAFHRKTGTIFLAFTNHFGDFDAADVMLTDLMSAAVREPAK